MKRGGGFGSVQPRHLAVDCHTDTVLTCALFELLRLPPLPTACMTHSLPPFLPACCCSGNCASTSNNSLSSLASSSSESKSLSVSPSYVLPLLALEAGREEGGKAEWVKSSSSERETGLSYREAGSSVE